MISEERPAYLNVRQTILHLSDMFSLCRRHSETSQIPIKQKVLCSWMKIDPVNILKDYFSIHVHMIIAWSNV